MAKHHIPVLIALIAAAAAKSGAPTTENICITSDGKRQPIIFNAATDKIVYPSSTCGPGVPGTENICLRSDGKRQPIIFDDATDTIVYPSGTCGPDVPGTENICITSDGKSQPIIFDDATDKIVYPSGTCAPNVPGTENICITSDGKRQPIIFDAATEKVVYPSGTCGPDDSGELFSGDNLYMVCIGSGNSLEEKVKTCTRVSRASVERYPSGDERGCKAYRTGLTIPATKESNAFFHTIFEVCWDSTDDHPRWVKNRLNPRVATDYDDLVDTAIRARFRFTPQIFDSGKGRYNPRRYFSVASQREERLLVEGKGCTDFYSRGHLAPAGDFFLAVERWATFSLENAVPQWQTHNNGEWKEIEYRARRLKNAFEAETGPIFYPNRSRSNRVYLDPDRQRLPVPDALYKKVYDKGGNVLMYEESEVVSTCRGG